MAHGLFNVRCPYADIWSKTKKLSCPHDHYCVGVNITPTSPTLVCNEGGTDADLESAGPGIPQRLSINCPKAETSYLLTDTHIPTLVGFSI